MNNPLKTKTPESYNVVRCYGTQFVTPSDSISMADAVSDFILKQNGEIFYYFKSVNRTNRSDKDYDAFCKSVREVCAGKRDIFSYDMSNANDTNAKWSLSHDENDDIVCSYQDMTRVYHASIVKSKDAVYLPIVYERGDYKLVADVCDSEESSDKALTDYISSLGDDCHYVAAAIPICVIRTNSLKMNDIRHKYSYKRIRNDL